ncbi:MAG: PTS transporter subunit IIC [Oscillospiraceae bacterium]|jgi:PTS system ascorbate-specific IIC component|nr:PTS transporter subunit IIC [Oscillospiraceae bacterium]
MVNFILDLLLKQILGTPFILIAIIVFVGYAAMKQPFGKSLTGAIKAAIGMLVLGVGSSQLIANFGALLTALTKQFGVKGVLMDTYSTMVACNQSLGDYASWSIYTLLVAFLVNILLVAFRKYTKIRSVFLTGNVMVVQAAIATYIVYRFLHTPSLSTIFIAGVITALYWGIMSTLLIKPTHEITGADFTIGHQQMLGSLLAYKIAGKVGNPKDDIERKKLPGFLSIFQDNIVASAMVFLISVTVIFIAMGGKTVTAMAGTTNIVIYTIKTALTLAANIYILLAGVRMLVGELMISFKGFSEKLLPGAVVAVDCAATYGFAPKSVILGFLFGAFGQIAGVLALLAFHSPFLVIVGFIPMFFDNATIGIFANKKGGWKAAAGITFCSGIIQVVGTALAASMMGLSFWQGSFDWATIWVAIIAALKGIGALLGIPVV